MTDSRELTTVNGLINAIFCVVHRSNIAACRHVADIAIYARTASGWRYSGDLVGGVLLQWAGTDDGAVSVLVRWDDGLVARSLVL